MSDSAKRASEAAAARDRSISKAEWAVAILFTLTAIYFHVRFAVHVGGLWRDEVNTVGVASLPTLGDVWRHLEFDSFPLVWMLIVRVLHAVGMASDGALRFVGCLIGLAGVGTLWFLARGFYRRPPLVSLLLFGLAPNVIIWGDTARAHGIGILTGLIAFGCIWRAAQAMSRPWLIVAAAASILAVQTSYYNSVVVFAAIAGGATAALTRRDVRQTLVIIALGVPAAVSLLPYLLIFHRAHEWNIVVQAPAYTWEFFRSALVQALAPTGILTICVWLFVAAVMLAIAVDSSLDMPNWVFQRLPREVVRFNTGAFLAGGIAYYLFLSALSYYTQIWYYLTLLAMAAVTLDAVQGIAFTNPTVRIARLVCCVVGYFCVLPGLFQNIPFRLTNIDLIAQNLSQVATERDLIILNPWYLGITYERYASGKIPWTTLPPLAFHGYHRYDLIKEMMMRPDSSDPIQPLIEQTRQTLSHGGRVYIVGNLYVPKPKEPVMRPPPAPQAESGWNNEAYQMSWTVQYGLFLRDHAINAHGLPDANKLPVNVHEESAEDEPDANKLPVNRYENEPVTCIEGWRTGLP